MTSLCVDNVGTLFLIEDASLTSMGLDEVNYSVGGGSDESGQTLRTRNSVPIRRAAERCMWKLGIPPLMERRYLASWGTR